MTSFGDLHLSVHDDGGYIDTHFNVYGRDQITFPTQMLGKANFCATYPEFSKNKISFGIFKWCYNIYSKFL